MDFNFDRLRSVYGQARQQKAETIAFETQIGRGTFLFMIFFSPDDPVSDILFLYLKRTRHLIRLKMYGNHRDGVFRVFINATEQAAIIAELDLGTGTRAFSFETFLAELNARIPDTLPPLAAMATLHANRQIFRDHAAELGTVIDDAQKTHLLGVRRLTEGHRPRERTLRKLYLHVDGNLRDIERLVEALKRRNMTVAWSADERGTGLSDILTRL